MNLQGFHCLATKGQGWRLQEALGTRRTSSTWRCQRLWGIFTWMAVTGPRECEDYCRACPSRSTWSQENPAQGTGHADVTRRTFQWFGTHTGVLSGTGRSSLLTSPAQEAVESHEVTSQPPSNPVASAAPCRSCLQAPSPVLAPFSGPWYPLEIVGSNLQDCIPVLCPLPVWELVAISTAAAYYFRVCQSACICLVGPFAKKKTWP